MNREKVYKIITAIFLVLTFVGVGYVLINKGEQNAGFAVIPSLFCITFSQLTIAESRKNKK